MSCNYMYDDEVDHRRSKYMQSMLRCLLGLKRVNLLGVFPRRQLIFIRGKEEEV